MNTRISHLQLKHDETSTTKRTSLFQSGVNLINELLSLIVTAFAAIFAMWINGKQRDFDQMQDKSH